MKKQHMAYYYCGTKGKTTLVKYIQNVTCKKCRMRYHKSEAKRLFG
jgi:hypothetical protein